MLRLASRQAPTRSHPIEWYSLMWINRLVGRALYLGAPIGRYGMPTAKCGLCAADIPEGASACPHCQATVEGQRLPLGIVLLICATLGGIALYLWA